MSAERVLAGRYVLTRRIGTGGAGVVWRAHDRVLDRVVAVKLLHPDLARDDATASRFRAEATAAAKLTHPHAVVVYDIGREHDRDYLVMELVEGATLSHVFTAGKLPPDVVALLGAQVARALGAAHTRGLVHRDVKPANVLVTADGVAKVADFGIARALGEATSRLTSPGHVMGTARYLAPEQLRDDDIDGRADVYALGLLLHQALTAQQPFGEGTAVELASRRLVSTVDSLSDIRADVPPALEAAVARATSIDPDDRYVDGLEFAGVLSRTVTADAQRKLARIVRGLPEPDEEAIDNAAAELEVDGLPEAGALAERDGAGAVGRDGVDRSDERGRTEVDAATASDGRSPVGSSTDGRETSPDATAVLAAESGGRFASASRVTDAAAASSTEDDAERTGPRRRMDERTASMVGTSAAAKSATRRPVRAGDRAAASAQEHRHGAAGDAGSSGQTPPPADPARRRRAVVVVAVLAVLAVGAVAIGVVPGMLGSDDDAPADPPVADGSDEQEPSDNGEPEPLTVVGGGDHDPFGDGEHPDDVPLAYDGDSATSWQTQQYRGSPELGGLKPGVGIWLDLGEAQLVEEIVLAAPGADVTIYAGDAQPQAGADPESFGTAVASVDGAGESETLTLDEPTEAQVFLVWLTSLPQDGEVFRASISDVTFVGS